MLFNAKDIFPDPEWRKKVRDFLDMFNGTVTRAWEDGKIKFDYLGRYDIIYHDDIDNELKKEVSNEHGTM